MTELTEQLLKAAVPGATTKRAHEVFPHLVNACRVAEITTPKRIWQFLAQCGHESGGFKYQHEIASGQAYEGRRDLGNVHPGDGRRYRGAGPIQITGRANFRAATKFMHDHSWITPDIDFEHNPELLSGDQYGFLAATWYWVTHHLNAPADAEDTERCTKIINGGHNGLPDRKARYAHAKKVLPGASLPAAGNPTPAPPTPTPAPVELSPVESVAAATDRIVALVQPIPAASPSGLPALAEWAIKEAAIGRKETPAGSNRGHSYDARSHLPGGVPWCAEFASSGAIETGALGIKRSASTLDQIADAKKHGTWHEGMDDLQAGDVVYKLRHGGGHVEVAVSPVDSSGHFDSVGGNTAPAAGHGDVNPNGGMVVRQKRNVGDWIGYIRPHYGEIAGQPAESPAAFPTVKIGSRGPAVASLQKLLHIDPADGVFGPRTDEAVKAFQANAGLAADGVVGAVTWGKLHS